MDRRYGAGARGAAVGTLALLLTVSGCTLDKPAGPNLSGPTDSGISVDLRALPDTVNGDGVSTSTVSLVLRNNLGDPLVNWPILFQCNGDGKNCGGLGKMQPTPGTLYVGPVQTGQVMATDGNGSTRVTYTAARATGSVTIGVRPYGTDTNLTPFYRFVEIALQ